jgi:hypothetical protein
MYRQICEDVAFEVEKTVYFIDKYDKMVNYRDTLNEGHISIFFSVKVCVIFALIAKLAMQIYCHPL